MTETDINEQKNSALDSDESDTTGSVKSDPLGKEADLGAVHRKETAVSPSSSPGGNGRGKAVGVTTLLLAFVVGLLVGYIVRPFTDQLAAGDSAEPVAQNEAVATNESTTENDSAATESKDEQPTPSANGESSAEDTGAEAPMLITPTPDRSGVIAALIEQNVRHFIGDEDAPVTLIEFSDFL